MTKEQYGKCLIELLKVMVKREYSQLIIEQTFDFLTVIPQEAKDESVLEFTKIAKEEPDEKKFHLKISDILREKLGWPPRKAMNQIQEEDTKNN